MHETPYQPDACRLSKRGQGVLCSWQQGRKPATTIPEETRNTAVDLYLNKYYDANFQHYTELLEEREHIHLSPSSVMKILEAKYILSPRVTKAKRKRFKKELLIKKENASSEKEADAIQSNLVAVEDAHSRRPRCAYFGEMQQMDASPYEWISGQTWHLHLSIDDATGTVTGAWFDTQEPSNGYYHVFHQVLTNYGIPYKFFTDRRTVFTYKQKTPHLSMRIPIPNSPMHANNSASFWNPAACHRQRVVLSV